jgi:hypothetical protein
VEYELADQWLAVLPDNVHLEREIVTAVRVTNGDARGEWSSTEGSVAGLQGRLVAYRREPVNGTPIMAVDLDLRNTAGGDNTVEFRLDGAKVAWTVTDAAGRPVAPGSPPGNWMPNPPRTLTLAAQQGGRLPLTISGAGISRDAGGHLELGSDHVWTFARGDAGPYYLSGTITIEPTRRRGQWTGTLRLPKVRVPLNPIGAGSEQPAAQALEKAGDRIEVRLVAAQTSPRRGQNLMVKLLPVRKADGQEVLVWQFPAHSFTPHELELSQAVRKAVPPLPVGTDWNAWKPARDEVLFSVPREFARIKTWQVDWAEIRLVSPQAEAKE